MVVQCTECSSQLSDRRALNKHLQRKHNIYPKVPTFGCFQCSQEEKSLPSLRKHSLLTHQQPILKICYTSRIGFQSKLEYANHVSNQHGLPIYDMDLNEIHNSTPTLSSINGGVNYYEFEPQSNDIDIMEYLYKKRDEISDIVRKHTNHYPQKLQLTVEMTLQKPSDNEPERVSVYFNTSTVVVYYEGISDETYEELVDNIVSKLVTFSSYGSGWQLLQIDKVTLKLVRYAPVRGRSFIPFAEGHPLRRDSNLLNIHNANDDKCFLYCYTAGYHLVFKKETLEPPGPCFRQRTNVLTYSSENPNAKQPLGDFDMRMSLLDIPRFEDMNEMQVNVLR